MLESHWTWDSSVLSVCWSFEELFLLLLLIFIFVGPLHTRFWIGCNEVDLDLWCFIMIINFVKLRRTRMWAKAKVWECPERGMTFPEYGCFYPTGYKQTEGTKKKVWSIIIIFWCLLPTVIGVLALFCHVLLSWPSNNSETISQSK